MERFDISIDDLVENPTTRVPVALVLDTSGSMEGEPIRELNEGYRTFIKELEEDEMARASAEVCVITFGGTVKLIQDFVGVDRIDKNVVFEAGGETPMGSAVLLALEKLENRKKLYREAGIDYHQPWMVLMTDGKPTDSIQEASEKTQELLENRKLVVFPVGIGPYADMETLKKFTTQNRPPLRLKGLKFREFFLWLSKSISSVSRSTPGANIKLADISGWAEL